LTNLKDNDDLSFYIYGDRDGRYAQVGHSVLYDNITITSAQRGEILREDFRNGFGDQWFNPGNVGSIVDHAGMGASTATIQSQLKLSDSDRHTYYSYDAAGRQRFMVDATGAVTETKYDAAGHVVETVQYANTVDPKNRAVRVAYTPNTNSDIHRSLGNFKAGDRVKAEVWFKSDVDTTGMLFLGDTGGQRHTVMPFT
jgi:hypothetical protein